MTGNINNQNFNDSLLKRFEEIHNYIYANEGLSSQQTLNEFIKILFAKIADEKNDKKEFFITREELIHDINCVYKRFSKLFQQAKEIYKDIFEVSDTIYISEKTLAFVISKLQNVNLLNNDTGGIAFQKFLSHYEKDSRGQFFTPQPVIDFCVEIIDPKPEENIVDPCCGSGGFLISSIKHLKNKYPQFDSASYITNKTYGIDINRDIAKIAKMRLILEANAQDNIICSNSLGDIDSLLLQTNREALEGFSGFDILLTNPPFGTAGKITDISILHTYDLGYKWKDKNNIFIKTNKLANGQSVEILFIERCLQLLKEGGRMGIVLPNGHFENSSLDYVRYFIKQKAKILGVVNLPQETFIPYGTGVKTSVLFLEKQTIYKENDYSLFFSKITKLGYQGNKNGNPIYKKDEKGNIILKESQPIIDEDFSNVITEYNEYRYEKRRNFNSLSYVIDFRELKSRLDYEFYSPSNYKMIHQISDFSLKLKEVVDIVKTKSNYLKNKELNVRYIELSDINAHTLEIINSTDYKVYELPSRASFELEENDIITAVAGNSIGTEKHASALVTNKHANCICTNGLRVLRNPKIDKYYLLFYLRSELFLKQVMMYRTGAAIPSISDKDLGNIMIYIPNEETIKYISSSVQRSLALRHESTTILESIRL